MSKIDDMIKELCPNGVEYKPMGKILTIKNGKDYKQFPEGNIPVYGSGGIMTYIDRYSCNKPSVLIPRKGSLNKLYYVDKPFWNVDTIFYTDIDDNILIPKYLYYFLQTQHLENLNKAGGVPSLTQTVLNKIEIPVPPIEIQQEIVRILDNFTNLTAELQAELQARKEQYEYYRNNLLSFDKDNANVKWMKMGDIGTFIRGNGLQKKDFVESGVGCIHYGQLYTHFRTYATKTLTYVSEEFSKKLRKAQYGDLVIATTSENVEDVCKAVAWLGKDEIAVSSDAYIYHHNQNPKYISYLFQTDMFLNFKRKVVTGTKVMRVSGDSMAKFEIPIPPLSEQERIVSILDKFEALVNDLTSGLPAEIAALQEQYEYYRNKLLTFERSA